MSAEGIIDARTLGTEQGVKDAAITIAETFCVGVLWPVANHTPPQMRQALFERLFCALAGALCAELGPERAKQTIDMVRLAIDDAHASRETKH